MDFKSNIWKLYLFKFLKELHFFSGVLIPFFTLYGKISFTQIMILQAWFMFWFFLLEVPTGAVADYFGRKYSLMIAALVQLIGVIVYVSKPSFYIFLLGEFIWAISAALSSGADEALLYDTLKKTNQSKQSKKIFGRMESFSLAGIMIGAPIGSLLGAKLGLRAPFLFMTIPIFLAFLISLTIKEPVTTKKIESKRYFVILKEGIKYFHNNKILKILAFDLVAISSIAYFMLWLYQKLLIKVDLDLKYFGLVHASFVISQILIIGNYQKIENLLGSKKRLVFLSALITGIMYIIGGLTTSLPIILGVIIIGGGFGLGREPLFSSYMNKFIPSDKRATIWSTISMLRRFVLVIINPIIGMLVDWSLDYTLIILGILAIIFSFISKVEEDHLID